jgi:uncharacterized delta-60 repeat protein
MNQADRRKSLFFIIVSLNLFFSTAYITPAQLDPSFGSNGVTKTSLPDSAAPIAGFVLPDTKILVVAGVQLSNNLNRFYFIRYNSNGSPDATYGTDGRIELPLPMPPNTNIHILNAIRQPDGKIILAGWDSNAAFIARLNENGTLDQNFAGGGIHRPNINQNGFEEISAVAVQADGKIVVGGYVQYAFGPNSIYLLRYHPNGTLDESFGMEGYIIHSSLGIYQDSPQFLFLQSTGKIITVSSVDTNTATSGSVRRFNSDGSVDNTFTTIFFPSNGFGDAQIQPDDQILISRYVQKNETLERQHTDISVSRFEANGNADTNFGNGGQATVDLTGYFDDFPNALEVLPNGEILVASRTEVQPNRSAFRGSMMSLVRLSATGATLGKLLVTNSLGHYKTAIIPQPDGKVLLLDYIYNSAVNETDILLARVIGVPPQTYRFRGVPFDFRFPAFDGVANPAVFRPSDRKWYMYNIFPGYFYGLADDIPVPSDYIQDLATDMAVFRPSNGTWYIAKDYHNAATNYITIQFGQNGDIPVPADYDGDGKSDLAVFRPLNGTWYIRNSADNSVRIVQWGLNGDKPSQGDFDGDGLFDPAVFRPSDGNWYVLKSSDNQMFAVHFGADGDVPVQEDYDGDGKTDIAVQRPSDGVWYRLNSSDGSFFALQWGISSDVAVPADYDGDLKTDIAVWRPSNGRWYVYQSSTNSMNIYTWGISTDIPLQRKM